MVGALSEHIHRHDGFRPETQLTRRGNTAFKRRHRHVEAGLIDIDEHRRRAGQRHGLSGCAECKGGTEHRIARADALGHQHHQKRIGTAGTAHDVLGPGKSREGGFELRHFRTVDELAMVKNAGDGLIDGLAEPPPLRGKVDEGNRFGTQVLVHGALE